jgi:serine/threonine-protein kinase
MDTAALQQRLQHALGNQFTVGPVLGQGGFAVVFRARPCPEPRCGREGHGHGWCSFALARRAVRARGQTIARLEHPHIVPIYEVGQPGDLLYIVMRCVDGPSLRQLLGTTKRLSTGDAARVARAVADALAYAHSESIVHRDVKPDNILLDKRGHVLVTDFGIAKAAQAATAAQLTTEGMIIGTPQYMSPEQAAGDAVDGRSDIYALGLVLYQMLAGSPPFDGDSSAKIIAQQLTATPPDIRQARSDVTPELAAVLERLLAKDPAHRYQTAGEVSRALVGALPVAARDRVQPRRRQLLSLALKSLVGIGAAGCLTVIAFVAGAVAVFWYVLSEPPRISTGAAVPDSLEEALVARQVLAPDDTIQLAFQPGDRGDSILFVVSQRRVAVVTPHHARGYPRDSVAYTFDGRWKAGLDLQYVLILTGGRRDTVYPEMSPRGAWALSQHVDRLLPEDSVSAGGLRVDTRLPERGPVRIQR